MLLLLLNAGLLGGGAPVILPLARLLAGLADLGSVICLQGTGLLNRIKVLCLNFLYLQSLKSLMTFTVHF